MHTCQIKWIDENGEFTPDNNPAIGKCWRKASSYTSNGGFTVHHEESEHFYICEEHAKRLANPGMDVWEFEAIETTETETETTEMNETNTNTNNKLYAVVYRTGGWMNAQWRNTLPSTLEKAEQLAHEITLQGYKNSVRPYNHIQSVGLPVGFCHHANAITGEMQNKTCTCN